MFPLCRHNLLQTFLSLFQAQRNNKHPPIISNVTIKNLHFSAFTIENNPDITQTTSAMFTLPVFINTPVGDTKIPEPMIEPYQTYI